MTHAIAARGAPAGALPSATTAAVLRRALELLGPNGEGWVQGSWRRGPALRCMAAACEDAAGGRGEGGGYERAIAALSLAADPLQVHPPAPHPAGADGGQCLECAENTVTGRNDGAADYRDIASVFVRAIENEERKNGQPRAPRLPGFPAHAHA